MAARHLQEEYFISGAAKHVGHHHRCWKAMHLGSGERRVMQDITKNECGLGGREIGALHYHITGLRDCIIIIY